MQASEFMTKTPICCVPDSSLREVAQMMVDHDCGAIPVVETFQTMRLLGIITDRDITCRTIAKGKNPQELLVKECMSSPTVAVNPESTLEECCLAMEKTQVRRIPVVDERGSCVGLVSQAHVVQHSTDGRIVEMLRRISRSTQEPSQVAAVW